MKYGHSLLDLHRAAYRRSEKLRLLARSIDSPITPADRRLMAWLVIEGAALWTEYSKAFYYGTALQILGLDGNRISCNAQFESEAQALTFAVARVRSDVRRTEPPFRHSEEPNWRQPGVITRLLTELDANTLDNWLVGIGIQSRFTTDVHTMRNFFAHKGSSGAAKALRLGNHYGVVRPRTPYDVLTTTPPAASDPVLWTWFDDLATIIRFMR